MFAFIYNVIQYLEHISQNYLKDDEESPELPFHRKRG
jgi:hypothetical protein